MADIDLVIKISEERFRDIQRIALVQLESNHFKTAEQIIAKGTPQPKVGHWIEHEYNGIKYIECSKCLCWFLRAHLLRNSYCPNCGTKQEWLSQRSAKK